MNYFTLRSNFKGLEHRLRQLRKNSPSLEQATNLLELTGAYAGLSVGSPACSMEAEAGVESILDKVEDNINRVKVTLEWFFNKAKEQKAEAVTAHKAPTESEKVKHIRDKYSNSTWVNSATIHVKPTILSGTNGGVLSDKGKVLSVDETIRKLEDGVKKLGAFLKDAEKVYPNWMKWGDSITAAVTKEWEAHKTEESIPSITKVITSLYSKQPPRPSEKYKLESCLSLGVPKDFSMDDFETTLKVADVHAEFQPLTPEQVLRLAKAASSLYELGDDLIDLSEKIMDGMGFVGFDDYPYRAEQVEAAIADFGWKKANWDAHAASDELSFIDLVVDATYKQFNAIHSWLYNAVVERP